jgi:hypothetical protein
MCMRFRMNETEGLAFYRKKRSSIWAGLIQLTNLNRWANKPTEKTGTEKSE